MKLTTRATSITLALASLALGSTSASYLPYQASSPSHLQRLAERQQQSTPQEQEAIVQQAWTDPVGAARAAEAMPFIQNTSATGGLYSTTIIQGDGNQQLPWNAEVYFQPAPDVEGDPDDGWRALPEMPSFSLNRSLTITENAVMPFYQSEAYDASKIKRAILVMPGKPRDSWKYTMLLRNALSVAVTNTTSGVTNDSVLIIGPAWMNTDDRNAGAVLPGELYWYGTQWQRGANARGPGDVNISTYQVLDAFLDILFDKAQFPALNRVMIAGHSMGAQMAQRYALVKPAKSYDKNVGYWVGNPGSYGYPTSTRPVANESCDGDVWGYGFGNGSMVPSYVRSEVRNDRDAVTQRYFDRNVHYFLGLNDNGQGDRSCEASQQGANHLDRGCKFVQYLAETNGAEFPSAHTANFVALTSHQDYPMLSSNTSLWRLFADGLDTREDDVAVNSTRSPGQRGGGNSASSGSSDLGYASWGVASLTAVFAMATSLLL
ncbi:hypothetical protein IE53DRAFT_78745 [Violaceomyces palustris]|uniref:Uncharacterized protein n=1 Tax=Violaceomyces palustris TaxID=1673888 RepID=A0ACD0NYC7_9BASI|nr:hypothetical protein IE53DRAFT_78745 [Violaceomyces palustris]